MIIFFFDSGEETHLTFPPQNWHSSPCHPSAHKQVPLTQSPPFMQLPNSCDEHFGDSATIDDTEAADTMTPPPIITSNDVDNNNTTSTLHSPRRQLADDDILPNNVDVCCGV